MTKQIRFLTGIKCYLFPKGSNDDPDDLKGIGQVLANVLLNGTSDKPDSVFYSQLEALGASISVAVQSRYSYIVLRAPQNELEKASQLVEELIENPNITEKSVKNAKIKVAQDFNDLKSSDIDWAITTAAEYLVGRVHGYGSTKSLGMIETETVKTLWDKYVKERIDIEVLGPKSVIYPKKVNLGSTSASLDVNQRDKKRINFISKDLEQKVLVLGAPAPMLKDYSSAVRTMSNSLLSSSGFAGLIFEKVREGASAAYYAYGGAMVGRSDSALFAYVGTSEDKLEKVVSLLFGIYNDVANGKFSPKRVEQVRNVFKTGVLMMYDNVDSITSYIVGEIVLGNEVQTLNELLADGDSIKKDDLVALYSAFLEDVKWGITINGQIDEKLQKKLTKEVLK